MVTTSNVQSLKTSASRERGRTHVGEARRWATPGGVWRCRLRTPRRGAHPLGRHLGDQACAAADVEQALAGKRRCDLDQASAQPAVDARGPVVVGVIDGVVVGLEVAGVTSRRRPLPIGGQGYRSGRLTNLSIGVGKDSDMDQTADKINATRRRKSQCDIQTGRKAPGENSSGGTVTSRR